MITYRGSQIYGARLLLARQFNGRSRRWLGMRSRVPAHYIRAIERAEVTTVDDESLRRMWAYALGVLPPFFCDPEPVDSFRDAHVCETEDLCCCGNTGATLLCDGPAASGGTCDVPLCVECRTRVGDLDLCPACEPQPPPRSRKTGTERGRR